MRALGEHAYLADRGLATVLSLALALEKPLLLEGEAGVGKTEVAKALAEVTGGRLIRLQCYEGIDVAHALYDWSYARQLLYIRTLEASRRARRPAATLHELFGREFLERRPLLDAIEHTTGAAGAADRRDRPRRRRVRGVPARAAVRLPGHDPRDRHDPGGAAAAGDADLEPHPRAARRAQAPLPVPLDRASRRSSARSRSCAPACPACPSGWRPRRPRSSRRCATLDLAKAPGVAETIDWAQALRGAGAGGARRRRRWSDAGRRC